MQILETKLFPVDGVQITMFQLDNPTVIGVRMVDTDAGETIAVHRWPQAIPDAASRAKRYFDELVQKCQLAGDQ